VLAARQRAGQLDRRTFAAADITEHLWFRTRLVQDLAADADHLVVFPRANASQEIGALTGADLNSGRRPWSIVPEGVSVRAITATAETLEDVADGAPVGMDRFASAWAKCPPPRDRFNAVIIGGSLSAPDADETAVLAALGQHRTPDSGLVEYQAHYDAARPHQGMAQLVPDDAPDALRATVTGISTLQLRRKPVLAAWSTNTRAPPDHGRPAGADARLGGRVRRPGRSRTKRMPSSRCLAWATLLRGTFGPSARAGGRLGKPGGGVRSWRTDHP
jgi:hypothetical protein